MPSPAAKSRPAAARRPGSCRDVMLSLSFQFIVDFGTVLGRGVRMRWE